MTDPSVRKRGLEVIAKGPEFEDWYCGISLLEKNLQVDDELILLKILESISPDAESHGCSIASAILDLAEANPEVPLESLLFWVYENTYCPNCRYRSVEYMIERNIAPQLLLEECLDDSYKYMRELAQTTLQSVVPPLQGGNDF